MVLAELNEAFRNQQQHQEPYPEGTREGKDNNRSELEPQRDYKVLLSSQVSNYARILGM